MEKECLETALYRIKLLVDLILPPRASVASQTLGFTSLSTWEPSNWRCRGRNLEPSTLNTCALPLSYQHPVTDKIQLSYTQASV